MPKKELEILDFEEEISEGDALEDAEPLEDDDDWYKTPIWDSTDPELGEDYTGLSDDL